MKKDLVLKNEHIAINKGFGTSDFEAALTAVMQRNPDLNKKKKSFAPSSLGYSGACPRYWYYAFNGADFVYENDPTAIANMDAGTDSGARLARLMEKAGILVEAEAKAIHDDPPIFGFIDAVVRWKGENIIAEVKTTTTETWQRRATSNTVPWYQLLQLLIYMYVTDTPRGFLMTENKNTHELFIYPVRMTDENKQWVEDVLSWMRTVKENADNGELPKRPFGKSSMQCKGCALKDTCWDGWTRGSVNGTDPNPGVVDLPPLEKPQ